MKEHKLIQSYVGDKYFISTAYRRASTAEEFWYYETIVWGWDWKTGETGDMLFTDDSGYFQIIALKNHADLCKKYLFKDESM